ncbi:MAG: ribulose-phosphate 3-epimerase [Brevinema sp.]
MKQLLPSIFAADFSDIKSALETITQAGVRTIHYDVMDNHFVPNMSFGVQFVQQVMEASSQEADIHLMISPIKNYEPFLDLQPKALTIHYEAEGDIRAILKEIRKKGVKAGISLKPSTPVSVLKGWEDEIDLLLLMSVEPGFSFQSFMPETLSRVKEARALLGSSVIIEADGGINRSNTPSLIDAGLDWFVMGGGFFRDTDQKSLVEMLSKLS